MPARHYGQFLDSSFPGQSADDDYRLASAPPEVLRGSFRVYYIPLDDSTYSTKRYLLSVQTLADHLAFAIEPVSGQSQIAVRLNGALRVALGPITFAAGEELDITFDAPDGRITLSSPSNGTTVTNGTAWNVAGSQLRLGGDVVGTKLARGYVSLPYAVPGAALPDPVIVDPSALDFSDSDNSGLLGFL